MKGGRKEKRGFSRLVNESEEPILGGRGGGRGIFEREIIINPDLRHR
jgi:hypothetical protein